MVFFCALLIYAALFLNLYQWRDVAAAISTSTALKKDAAQRNTVPLVLSPTRFLPGPRDLRLLRDEVEEKFDFTMRWKRDLPECEQFENLLKYYNQNLIVRCTEFRNLFHVTAPHRATIEKMTEYAAWPTEERYRDKSAQFFLERDSTQPRSLLYFYEKNYTCAQNWYHLSVSTTKIKLSITLSINKYELQIVIKHSMERGTWTSKECCTSKLDNGERCKKQVDCKLMLSLGMVTIRDMPNGVVVNLNFPGTNTTLANAALYCGAYPNSDKIQKTSYFLELISDMYPAPETRFLKKYNLRDKIWLEEYVQSRLGKEELTDLVEFLASEYSEIYLASTLKRMVFDTVTKCTPPHYKAMVQFVAGNEMIWLDQQHHGLVFSCRTLTAFTFGTRGLFSEVSVMSAWKGSPELLSQLCRQ